MKQLAILFVLFWAACAQPQPETAAGEQPETVQPSVFRSVLNEPVHHYYGTRDVFKDFQAAYCLKIDSLRNADPGNVHVVELWNNEALDFFLDQASAYENLEALKVSQARVDATRFARLVSALKTKRHFTKLMLSGVELSELPPSIADLPSLQTLDLAFNELTTLPPEIGNLQYLTFLRVRNNRGFSHFPSEIGKLKMLRELDFSGTQLTRLTDGIGGCTELRILTGNASGLSAIPDSLGNCTELRDINLGYNRIGAVPASIGNLTKLERLSLGGNWLIAIPASFAKLKALTFCDLARNDLAIFPAQVLGFSKLKNLWLHENAIGSLPAAVGDMPSLTHLLIDVSELNPSDVAEVKRRNPELRIIEN